MCPVEGLHLVGCDAGCAEVAVRNRVSVDREAPLPSLLARETFCDPAVDFARIPAPFLVKVDDEEASTSLEGLARFEDSEIRKELFP